MKHWWLKYRRRIKFAVTALAVLALGFAGETVWTLTGRYKAKMYALDDVDQVPRRPVAVVFGAGYWPSGALSDVLRDRMDAAIALYRAGRVDYLLCSGDNRFVNYNEPAKMLEYALEQGVPREAIVLDYAGRRTYDTCYRARDIFQVRDVVLVTQRFHMPRALMTCQSLGMNAVGVIADQTTYVHIRRYWVREVVALWRAWLDIYLLHPVPILGEPLPILK